MEAFLPQSTPANAALSYSAGDCQTALLHLSEEQHTIDAHHLLSKHVSVHLIMINYRIQTSKCQC